MTPSQKINAVAYEIPPHVIWSADFDRACESRSQRTCNVSVSQNQADKTTAPPTAKHWRIQFLRHSASASTARGIAGVTPPYCPAGPPLYREPYDELLQQPVLAPARRPSPLRNISYRFCSEPSIVIKYGSAGIPENQRMPHAVNMPHSGFQALILCGPGIGLSTFTNVPSEHPKALVNVANRPMVWYVLDWCYRMGVTDITLITPPSAKNALTAALGQNPYLTSLPSPSPDLLAPEDLEFTTPTAELLRLPEVQKVIKGDFLLLPCDLVCDISGDSFLETYLTSLGGVGGAGARDASIRDTLSASNFSAGGEGGGRRGGLSIWYNTANREESVKGEECDFMATTELEATNHTIHSHRPDASSGRLRKLVSTMPMSELWDIVEEDKAWKVRQSLLRKYGAVKCMTQFRDSHIYFFPHWVKEFAALNEDFESVSEDLVGTWANAEWRKPGYRARYGVQKIFASKSSQQQLRNSERPIEDELDLLSLSSTQVTRHSPNTVPFSNPVAQLASRVQARPGSQTISADVQDGDDLSESASIPIVPPVLSYILSAEPSAPLVRRVDNTPLLLSVSLLLAKVPSIEESTLGKSTTSPFAHASKVAGTATIAQRVTISRNDTLIDSNTTVATQCVIKSSCVGSAVSIGSGARITGCVIMDGATIGEKCVLTNTVVGKKAKIGKGCTLQNCEVQDGNAVSDGTDGKGEKYLVGGLEDEMDEGEDGFDDDGDDNEESEGISLEV